MDANIREWRCQWENIGKTEKLLPGIGLFLIFKCARGFSGSKDEMGILGHLKKILIQPVRTKT